MSNVDLSERTQNRKVSCCVFLPSGLLDHSPVEPFGSVGFSRNLIPVQDGALAHRNAKPSRAVLLPGGSQFQENDLQNNQALVAAATQVKR